MTERISLIKNYYCSELPMCAFAAVKFKMQFKLYDYWFHSDDSLVCKLYTH